MAIINLGKVVPERGVDYWTDEDKEEIINQVETDIDITTVRQAIQTLQIDSAHTLEMSLNQTTYQLTLILKNINGTVLSTQTVNFPNEDAITNIVYNSNKTLTVTKQSGTTSTVDLSPIIAGLYTKPSGGIPKTDLAEAVQTSLGKADTAIQEHQDISGKEDKTNKVTELSSESTDEQYPSAKAVYDGLEESYTEISKLQDKVAKQKKVIDGLPQVEDTGEEVVLDKTMEAEMIEFDTKGNSKQETTEGKNLFNNDAERGYTTGHNNYSKIDTGIRLTATNIGSSSATAYLGSVWKLIDLSNYVGKTVRVKATITPSANQYSRYMLGVCNSDVSSRTQKSGVVGSDTVASFVVPEFAEGDENTYLYVLLYLNYLHEGASIATDDYTDFTNLIVTIDNEDMTYEKFTYGASPNPYYEQPVSNCGDNINLFDKENISWYRNNSSDFENTLDTSTTRIRTNAFEIIGGKTYTVSGFPNDVSLISIRAYNEDKLYDNSYATLNNNTFILTAEVKYIYLLFGGTNFTSQTNIMMANADIKIEEGSIASGYSPYGMGSITEKIVNKNLINITEDNMLVHCSYVSGANTNEYKLLCTASDMYVNEIQTAGTFYKKSRNGNLIPCKYGETIYYDTGNSLFTKNFFVEFDKNLIALEQHAKATSNGTYTPTNSNCAFIIVRMGYGSNAEAGVTYTLAPIVTKTSDTTYIPHYEQNIVMPTQQPMRSVGDVRDEFVKIDGVWKERHNIARHIFDGTEVISYDSTSNWTFRYTPTPTVIYAHPSNYNYVKCNWLQGKATNKDEAISIWQSLIVFRYDLYKTGTSDNFKTWLAQKYANGTPVYVDYVLTTPIDLACTADQIAVLENLPESYKGQTLIYSEDEIPSNVYAKALYDINDLISRVEVLESEV